MLAQGVWLRGYYDTLSVVARCIRAIDIRHIIILVTDLEYFEKAIVDRVALFLYELIYKKIKTAVEMSEAETIRQNSGGEQGKPKHSSCNFAS